jgi:hypothetical protein
MSDAPETIWALYAPEVGEDHPQCTIVAGDEPIYGAMQYTRTDHSQALIAAAYEAASLRAWKTASIIGFGPSVAEIYALVDGLKALTPADAKAALDKLIADAERRGMERAAVIVEPNNPRSDWTERAHLMAAMARLIRAAMEPKT